MPKTATTLVLLMTLGCAFLCPAERTQAQSNVDAPQYDYYSLALASISSAASEASKVENIPSRVRLLMCAARLLASIQPVEATRLLDVALADLKAWESEDQASWYQRHEAANFRNEVFALYARLDSAKAQSLMKSNLVEPGTNGDLSSISLKRNDWFKELDKQRTLADQFAMTAFSLWDTDPEKAAALILKSLQTGIVADAVCDVVRKASQAGNRQLLDRLEIAMGVVLTQNVTFDPYSFAAIADIVQTDQEIPAAARMAFIRFFMHSLQNVVNNFKEPGTDADYLSRVLIFSSSARPVIAQFAREQLLAFDILLEQLATLAPEKTRTSMQAFEPEKFREPRVRLAEILKDPNPQKRDRMLARLVSELLQNKTAGVQDNFEIAADVISGLSESAYKVAFGDLLTLARIDRVLGQQKFIEAQQLSASISSDETRTWALLALAGQATKADRVLGFELVSSSLKALAKTSPSPRKVELALAAAAMLTNGDPQRAFDTLMVARDYANSTPSQVDPPTKPVLAYGLDGMIGNLHTKLGVFPESLGEVKIEPVLAKLATRDWFRAGEIVEGIRDPSLRLQLKLQFAEAMLAQETKGRRDKKHRKTPAN